MFKILAILSVSIPLALAQSGTVQSGSQPIPRVTVRATLGERAISTISDDNGAFQFQGMTPGTWTVEADMFGFDHFKRDFPITDTPSKIDVAMTLGRLQITQRPPAGPVAQALRPSRPLRTRPTRTWWRRRPRIWERRREPPMTPLPFKVR